MGLITDSQSRINDVDLMTSEFRNIDTDATIVVVDSILDDRFEVDGYVDTSVINVER